MRDAFGFTRQFHGARCEASTIRGVLAAEPDLPRTLDVIALRAYLAREYPAERTFLAAVRAAPLGPLPAARPGELAVRLYDAIAHIIGSSPRPIAVALSGGLDSAIVLAIATQLDPTIRALVLDPQLPDYSEREAALHTAACVGITPIVVPVTPDAFRAAVPAAIAAFEVPVYNLHPVSKWLLATAAREHGFATVISGDGADQVFTRDVSTNYLPLVSAAFGAAGVTLRTPFLDEHVASHVVSLAPDPGKQALRDVGATLRIPQTLVREAKQSRLAPAIDLSALVAEQVGRQRVAALGDVLGMAADTSDVRWATLAMLVAASEEWR